MQEDSLTATLHALIQERQLSQKDVARAADISQSTVSRTLSGKIIRRGQAKKKLFKYMQQELWKAKMSTGKNKIIEAFESIWDGSEAQADAVANIIEACGKLTPAKNSGGND